MSLRGARPRWWRGTALAVLVAVPLTAAGCSAATGAADTTTTVSLVPTDGGTLTVGIDQAPTGCNPNAPGGDTWANRLVLEPVLPSVSTIDASEQADGDDSFVDQAELVSTDPQTIDYTIDPDATWSDGVPVTAADFLYAWQQQRGAAVGQLGAAATGPGAAATGPANSVLGYRDIKSMTPSNHGKTVTVVFKTPFADWRMLFGDLLPAHVLQRTGWDPSCSTIDPAIDLSAGPYVIRSVTPRRIVLAVNPKWWGTSPSLDRIVVRIASGPSELARWARQGKVQVLEASSFRPADLVALNSDPMLDTEVDVSSRFVQLEFATTSGVASDLSVREAVAHAVDRQALTESTASWANANIVPAQSHLFVQTQGSYPHASTSPDAPNPLAGAHEPGTTTTTTTGPDGTTSFPLTADASVTARLLSEDGYVLDPSGQWRDLAGQPLTLRLVVDSGDGWVAQAADTLTRQLQHAGFDVTVTDAPSAEAAGTALSWGAADMALLPFDTSPYPSQALAWYTQSLGPAGENGSEDWSNFDDQQVTKLLTEAATQLNPVKAQPFYTEADQLLWAQMVALPLFAEPALTVWSTFTSRVSADPEGPSLLTTVDRWQLRVPESVAESSTAPRRSSP